MAFERVVQIRNAPRNNLHAAFSVPEKGAGNLRITMAGVRKLQELGVALKGGDWVEMFFDKATGQIALQKADQGMFKLSRSSPKNESLRITSQALAGKLKKTSRFRMEASGKFDVVLLPVAK